MTQVALLTISSTGVTIPPLGFIGQQSPEGRPPIQLQQNVETLEAAGVDGTRFRIIGRRWRPWTWATMAAASTMTSASQLADLHESCQGLQATIQIYQGSGIITLPRVQIVGVKAKAAPYPLFGPGIATVAPNPFDSTIQAMASVGTVWTLRVAYPAFWAGT